MNSETMHAYHEKVRDTADGYRTEGERQKAIGKSEYEEGYAMGKSAGLMLALSIFWSIVQEHDGRLNQ